MLAILDTWQGFQPIALVGALCLAVILAIVNHRLRQQKRSLTVAIAHMTQGLCLFDSNERLVFCNQRYVEMYGSPPDIVKRAAEFMKEIWGENLEHCPHELRIPEAAE